jgi:DNA-binding SARP family transcriptional activator
MIRLRTLGSLDLRGAGGEELRAVLAQPRRAALLMYLALAIPRGTQRRDTILALFWPELDTDRARNALGQAVHFLRKSLGADAIVNRDGGGLAVDWSGFWCDAAAFEEALNVDRITDAIALYRGALLEGFHIDDAPEFERWLDAERARLAARYIKAVEALAAEREASGDFHGAALHWRTLVARDPYNSRLTLRLMRALKSAGDPAGALMQARQHGRLLREELAIAPDAEVAALVRRLQSEEPSQSAPALTPAPARSAGDRARVTERPAVQESTTTGARPRRRTASLTAVIAALTLVAGAALLKNDADELQAVAPVVSRTAAGAPSGTGGESYLQDLIVRGRNAEVSRSPTGLATAREAYERAVARDSLFALGYAGLSSVYQLQAWYGFAPKRPALDSARMMALRAFTLDSSLSEIRTAVARMFAEAREFDAAEREFKLAVRLTPTDGRAHYWYAALLVTLGRGHDALAEAKLAEQFDPLGPKTLAWQRHANWLMTGERPYYKLSPRERRPILRLEPGEPWARARLADDLAEAGSCTEAYQELERAQQLAPDNVRMRPHIGRVSWWCGERTRPGKLLEELKRRPDARQHGYEIALLHTLIGEKDSAFVWLGRHQDWTMLELTVLSVMHWFDPLRPDPRYVQLMRRLGIRP